MIRHLIDFPNISRRRILLINTLPKTNKNYDEIGTLIEITFNKLSFVFVSNLLLCF